MILGLGAFWAVLPIKTQAGEKRITIEYLEADYGTSETLYKAWLDKKQDYKGAAFNICSCVSFAKSKTGFNDPVGYAKNWPTNTNAPRSGGVVVLREGLAGHVAFIQDVEGDQIFLEEANYLPCKKTQRVININDPDILGYWSKND